MAAGFMRRDTMGVLQKIVLGVLRIIIAGAVLALLWWLVDYLGLPQPFGRVANGVLAIGAVFVLIALPQPFGRVANGVLAIGAVFVLIAIIMDLAGVPLIKLPGDKQ
jgi:hypothetical protein